MPKHLLLAALLSRLGIPHPSRPLKRHRAGPIFRFEADGFWLNLHHYLYVLGRAQNQTPDSQRRAVVNAPADQEAGLKGLSESHRQDWDSAVRFYAGGLSTMDAVFDQKLIAVTNAMRVPPNATAAALKIDPELRATLIRASQVYRLAFWPKHQAENHARVRDFARSARTARQPGAGLRHARLPARLAEERIPGERQRLHELGGRVFNRRRPDRRVELR